MAYDPLVAWDEEEARLAADEQAGQDDLEQRRDDRRADYAPFPWPMYKTTEGLTVIEYATDRMVIA